VTDLGIAVLDDYQYAARKYGDWFAATIRVVDP
jgi:hypothetical protein